jgi:hypothetical protein
VGLILDLAVVETRATCPESRLLGRVPTSGLRLSTLDVPIRVRQASISSRSRLHKFNLLRRTWGLRFIQARDVDDDEGNIVLLRHRGRLPASHL